jgi:hypothetical protein
MAARRWWRRRRLTRGCSGGASLAAILSDLVSGLAAVGPLLQLAREVQSSELSNWYQGQGCAALRQPVPTSVVRQQCGAAPPPVVGGRQTCTLHCESHICSGFCRHNSIVYRRRPSRLLVPTFVQLYSPAFRPLTTTDRRRRGTAAAVACLAQSS